ncbi:hypothetical protein ACQP25_18525 [Microtetraspora malaysiensis]|uniref:hypothetical protein n=1 Tax=Microtetraspora malaysiensis TaxID=161358 RepID=UPI003D941DAE
MNLLSDVFSVVFFLPVLVILVVGVVLTGRARREHGRAAVLGMVGCLVLLANFIMEALSVFALPYVISSWGIGGVQIFSFVTAVLTAILPTTGIGLLIWGVTASRPRPAQFPHPQQQPPYQG